MKRGPLLLVTDPVSEAVTVYVKAMRVMIGVVG